MNGSSDFPHPAYKRTVLSPLFDTVTAHHVEAFRSINRAHLVMLAETGILPADIAAAIARGLVDIDRSVDTATLTYTGEFEDYFFLVEAELAKRTGVDTAGCLHTARSRNDMDHTVFRLALKDRTDAMLDQAHALAQTLIEKATEERDTLIVAYTHGQPAQPSTFGHYLAAALEVLLRDIRRLQQACDDLDRCPMGAAAITTSGFPIDRNRIAELLGFARPLVNSYGCIASVDYVTGLYSGRVGTMDCSIAPLTEPDMRTTHPALWIGPSKCQLKLGRYLRGVKFHPSGFQRYQSSCEPGNRIGPRHARTVGLVPNTPAAIRGTGGSPAARPHCQKMPEKEAGSLLLTHDDSSQPTADMSVEYTQSLDTLFRAEPEVRHPPVEVAAETRHTR